MGTLANGRYYHGSIKLGNDVMVIGGTSSDWRLVYFFDYFLIINFSATRKPKSGIWQTNRTRWSIQLFQTTIIHLVLVFTLFPSITVQHKASFEMIFVWIIIHINSPVLLLIFFSQCLISLSILSWLSHDLSKLESSIIKNKWKEISSFIWIIIIQAICKIKLVSAFRRFDVISRLHTATMVIGIE